MRSDKLRANAVIAGEAHQAAEPARQPASKMAATRKFSSGVERSDKFKDECGVVSVYNNPEASTLAYLGLHALQHRGQESAGIIVSDGHRLHAHKAMGLVADIYTQDVIARLPGYHSIGHTRY